MNCPMPSARPTQRHLQKFHVLSAVPIGYTNVNVVPHWTMEKTVEKFPGEFGSGGQPQKDGQGEQMDIPFVLCSLST